jgi:hypothetical protein
MLDFKLNEENYFEFEMQITGDADTSEKPIVEFALEIKNGIKMSFLAEKKDSIYCVTLPPLKEFLSSGEHDFKLDVFLGDKFFTPYSGKCTFKEAAKPVISNIKVESKEQVKQPIVPTITFTQKDKVPVLVESPKEETLPITVNEEEKAKKEELKKESVNLDKLLGKKRGK